MNQTRSSPVAFFFLMMPIGIAAGFVTVTLPFVMTRARFPVAASASIVALGLTANTWNFFWGPVIDLTLTLRRWYALGIAFMASGLLLLNLIPLHPDRSLLLTALVLLTIAGVATSGLPVGGLMAHTVFAYEKGRASGWNQAGNLGGTGLGGGVGVWLASHFSKQVTGGVLAGVVLLCAAMLYFVPDVRPAAEESLRQRMGQIAKEFRQMIRSSTVLLTIIVVVAPIGVGAASNLWSAVAPAWRAESNLVALVVGFLSGLISAIGCIAGGWVADRVGRWRSFFGSGAIMALIGVIIAAAPRTPVTYASGVLCYAFSQGLAWAAFTALILHAVGLGAATTKFAILSSFGNIPVTYMTAFDGWVHDRFGVAQMLEGEALLAIPCIIMGLLAVRKLNASGRLESEESGNVTILSH